jgi:cytoskeletal protein RodZ
MAVLIFLIIVDLIMVGVVLYFVITERQKHAEHYVPETGEQPVDVAQSQAAPAAAEEPTVAQQPRAWAVETIDDSEAAAQAQAEPVASDEAEEGAETLVTPPEPASSEDDPDKKPE